MFRDKRIKTFFDKDIAIHINSSFSIYGVKTYDISSKAHFLAKATNASSIN